jgi:protein-histidine pros-kinase
MGLRVKFNLMLLIVAVLGAGLFAAVATPIVNQLGKQEVLQSSRIMMMSAAGARKYTSEQIAPLLRTQMDTTFHPQAVSAYAAKKTFDVLHAAFSDYSYREAALNPTNLEDRAVDWEADMINDFRDHPGRQEIVLERGAAMGRSLELARPIVATPGCLQCHSTPAAAPASMLAIYGPRNGFGWKLGEIIGAQIVTVPMSVASGWAEHVRLVFLACYVGVFALLFALLNLLLGFTVIGPIDRMTATAEAVSMGDMDTPEFVRGGSDQIARLSGAINRLRRSLREALRMLGETPNGR